jgi:hypothetical protein
MALVGPFNVCETRPAPLTIQWLADKPSTGDEDDAERLSDSKDAAVDA